jgi:inhibitor of KinA
MRFISGFFSSRCLSDFNKTYQKEEMNKKILFVYGTLKRGEFNDVSRYTPAPVFLGEGFINGSLYDLGHCPALVLDEQGGPVWGELFELDESLFEALDRYEDECGEFFLREATVYLKDKSIRACVYEGGASQTSPDMFVADGRWPLKRGVNERDIFPLGDQALLVDFERSVVGPRTSLIVGFAQAVRESVHPAVIDVVEAPGSVTVYYRPERTSGPSAFEDMKTFLLSLRSSSVASAARCHTIDVCYSPDFGADLPRLAGKTGMTVEALINQHVSQTYTVASQGFLPGFAYLEGVSEVLQFPRLGIPRPNVAAGSVAIAEGMCGIYPQEGPGGWNLIGRTPVRLFDPHRETPSLLLAGDRVSFRQMSLDDYAEVRVA